MLNGIRAALAAVLVGFMAFAAAPAAKADVTWVFQDLPFEDGGILSGSFHLNQYGFPDTWDVTTTDGSILSGYEYITDINSSISNDRTLIIFNHNDPAYHGYIHLTFANPLTDPGPNGLLLTHASYECGSYGTNKGVCTGPIRYFSRDAVGLEGTVGGVPEPATWAMLVIGIGGVGFVLRRSRRLARAEALAA